MLNGSEEIKTSTYKILSSYWDTSIGMCCLFASFVLAFSILITSFILKKYYADILVKSPFVKPISLIFCLLTAIVVAWLIQTFTRRGTQEEGNISYFVLSIASFFGRFVYESVYNHQVLFKGLFYLIGTNIIGNALGFGVGTFILYLFDKNSKLENMSSFKLTFYYEPLQTKVSVIKDLIVWFIFGASAPFIGYLAVYESKFISPFTAILMIMFVVFLALFCTQKFGFYNGNLVYSSLAHISNIIFFKHEKRKLIIRNVIISYPITIIFPCIWGAIYAII